MRQLSPLELDKAEILKTVRALIRMKHARAADRELNKVLPEIEQDIDKAIQSGKPYTLDPRKVLQSGGE